MTIIKIKRDQIQFEAGEADSVERGREWSGEVTRRLWDAGFGSSSGAEVTHGRDHHKLDIGAQVEGCWFWPEKKNGVPLAGTAVCHEPHLAAAVQSLIDDGDERPAAEIEAAIRAEAARALSIAIAAEEAAWQQVPA